LSGDLEPRTLPHELLTLAALAPDLLVDAVERYLAAAPWPDGPATAAPPQLLADVDARQRELEVQHAALVDKAGEAGIVLRHLDAEIGRRAQARLQRESAEMFNRLNARAIERGAVTPREVP
jgi:hypothetical protein